MAHPGESKKLSPFLLLKLCIKFLANIDFLVKLWYKTTHGIMFLLKVYSDSFLFQWQSCFSPPWSTQRAPHKPGVVFSSGIWQRGGTWIYISLRTFYQVSGRMKWQGLSTAWPGLYQELMAKQKSRISVQNASRENSRDEQNAWGSCRWRTNAQVWSAEISERVISGEIVFGLDKERRKIRSNLRVLILGGSPWRRKQKG